jgi:hypothetical protein
MDDGLLTTIIMAAGAGLSGAVGVLFRIVLKLQDKQIDTSERLGHYQGKHEGIERVHSEVLRVVNDAVDSRNWERKKGTEVD